MGSITNMKETYITRAILKDYLTIKEVDITFNKDINIIIGQNGTGKTNFINYLGESLGPLGEIENNNDSHIHFISSDREFLKTLYLSKYIGDDFLPKETVRIQLYQGGWETNEMVAHNLVPIKVLHGIPQNYYVADEPINDIVKKIANGYRVFANNSNALSSEIGVNYLYHAILHPKEDNWDINDSLIELNENLADYTNIHKVRIGINSKISEITKDEVSFNNLYLEYLVNGEWLLFKQLSDGTKRLFYVISEILMGKRPIVLLEEPELGLHPHQLYKLMEFIREMSDKYQFIITTHSPIVLNMLQKDELDSIIIATIEKGSTKLNHLTEEQIEKARAYMDVADLSDYWMHSDLEKA